MGRALLEELNRPDNWPGEPNASRIATIEREAADAERARHAELDVERLAEAMIQTVENVAYPSRWQDDDFRWVARQIAAEYAALEGA